ncbi:hypothetical protein ACWTCY_11440 [Anaerostipes caccae]
MQIIRKVRQKVKDIFGIGGQEMNTEGIKAEEGKTVGEQIAAGLTAGITQADPEIIEPIKININDIVPVDLTDLVEERNERPVVQFQEEAVEIEIKMSKRTQRKLMRYLTIGMNNERRRKGIPLLRHRAFEKAERNQRKPKKKGQGQ